jgi:hypothetical protein
MMATTTTSLATFINFLPRSVLLEQAHQQRSEFVLIPEAKTSMAHVNGKPVQ